MAFVYQQRPSDSPFVDSIWQTEDESDGMYLAAADGAWDMIFTLTPDNTSRVLLSGPSSRATPVSYQTGNRNVGIRFKPGVFVPREAGRQMLDVTQQLPTRSKEAFWLDHTTWELPTFDNADTFVDRLVRTGFLSQDKVVQQVLGGDTPAITSRSVQRRFHKTIGLTPTYLKNIERANQAVALLQRGKSIMDVVHELGFADQAHMTRLVKRISGCTPGEIVKKAEAARRFYSIQNYGVCGQMKVQNFKGGQRAHQTLQN